LSYLSRQQRAKTPLTDGAGIRQHDSSQEVVTQHSAHLGSEHAILHDGITQHQYFGEDLRGEWVERVDSYPARGTLRFARYRFRYSRRRGVAVHGLRIDSRRWMVDRVRPSSYVVPRQPINLKRIIVNTIRIIIRIEAM